MREVLLWIMCGLLVLGALANIARMVLAERGFARRQRRFEEHRDQVAREIAKSRNRMSGAISPLMPKTASVVMIAGLPEFSPSRRAKSSASLWRLGGGFDCRQRPPQCFGDAC